MGVFNPSILTEKGKNLIAKSVMGMCNITFTKIAISDTQIAEEPSQLTDIGEAKQSENVSSVVMQGALQVKVGASFSNIHLTEGYYIRNIGLYAMDPDEGEILYSVSVANESTATADWMPPFSNIGASSLVVSIVTSISNASSVNVTVDPAGYATVSHIADLQSQINSVSSFVGYEEDSTYGVEVDFSSKTITRIAGAETLIEGADFDALDPWGGRKRCILTDGGVKLAYYGETCYTESGALTESITVEGIEYPVGTHVQVMVEQPIFYIKAVPVKAKNATSGKGKQYVKARFYISPTPKVGFSIPRAFYDDRGIPQDKIYLSAYEGCIQHLAGGGYDLTDNSAVTEAIAGDFKLSSIAGAKPASGRQNNLTRKCSRIMARTRGSGWRLHSIFAMAVTEWLFMVEYASLDPQRKVGQGVSNSIGDGVNAITGATSSMGNISGIPVGGEDGKCSVTYRGEENLWGNIWTWLDGVNFLAKGVNEVWVAKMGTTLADDITEGYDCLSAYLSHTEGFISAFGIDDRYPEILIPTEANGSDTFADYVYENHTYDGFCVALFGGWKDGSKSGFSLHGRVPSDNYSEIVGARLLYVPQSITG